RGGSGRGPPRLERGPPPLGPGGPISGRRARARESRCRSSAGASQSSAGAELRLRRPAESTSSPGGPSWEPVENVPPVRICARQVQRQAVALAVDDDPARAVRARNRQGAALRVEAVRVAQTLLRKGFLRGGDRVVRVMG